MASAHTLTDFYILYINSSLTIPIAFYIILDAQNDCCVLFGIDLILATAEVISRFITCTYSQG